MPDTKKYCIIIPTYNNAGTLANVIRDVQQFSSDIIVVDDGSTDGTKNILQQFSGDATHVISYQKNRGKGHALKQGFKMALDLGFDYAITIDSDGQHKGLEIPHFLNRLDVVGDALIIGARRMPKSNVPKKNSFANKFSNFWFWIETGRKMTDTQSGYRLYPIHMYRNSIFFTSKYEFELEVLVRSVWKGIKVTLMPVDVYYPPIKERVSHFRPFKDFFRISILNTVLVTLALLIFRPLLMIRSISWTNIKKFIYNHVINSKDSNIKLSASVALGVFIGIAPIWGAQIITVLTLAYILKLNKLLSLVTSNISIPPMIPVILYLSYQTGAMVMGNYQGFFHFDSSFGFESVKDNIIQYVIGALVFGLMAALVLSGLTYFLLTLFRNKSWKA